LLLVLGFSGLFGSLTAKRKIVTRDFIYSIFAGFVLLILSFGFFVNGETAGVITQTNGLILLCFLGIYLYALIGDALRSARTKEEKTEFMKKDILLILVGIFGIVLGGQLVVNCATDIANMLNISQNVIALTVVAIGTSLPELVTSVVAAKKGEVDIAIGNVVGSNIFNIFFILGLSSAISPITFGFDSFIDIIVMVGANILVYSLLLKNMRIGNKKGIILLGTYVLYTLYILIR
jgi:cation:H+ antiporter